MKIIQITPSYKPAYIYGGPIMSVSKLCERIAELSVESSFATTQDDITQDDIIQSEIKLNGIIQNDIAQDDIIQSEITLNDIDQDDIIQDEIKRNGIIQNDIPQSGKHKVESEKFNLEVLTTTANGKVELNVETGEARLVDGVPVTYFKRWTKDHSHFSPGLLLQLNKVLRQAQQDNVVVHIHAWWNLVSVLSCWVAKWYKVPVILSPRGMLNLHTYKTGNQIIKKIIHLSIGKKLLQYCSIHATTDKEKVEIIDFIDADYINVIPNLARLGNLKSNNDKHNKKIFEILFLSRINPIKGLELLFEALARLDFDYRLTIAGSGDENYIDSLKRKVESLKLGERVKWIGQVGNEEKFKLMAEHDLLVLTSYNENFANVVIESLSVGTPVLISERVGLADYVKENELGWICNLEPKDIAEKITEAHSAIAKREKINSSAPFIIEKDFNDVALVRRYLELYENVLRLRSE